MAASTEALKLEDEKTPAAFDSAEVLIDHVLEDFGKPFFVKWKDKQLVCDELTGWAFADFSKWDTTGNPNSAWEIITDEFSSLNEALSFPILEGKSILERFGECKFFVEN